MMALIVLAGLGLVSCQSATDDEAQTSSATVHVSIAPFELQVTDFDGTSQKTVGATESGIASLTFAIFDENGENVYNATQNSTDEGFGNFSTELKFGTYTFVAVGCKVGTGATIESKNKVSFTAECLSDTYSASQSVEISATSSKNISIEMSRPISCLNLKHTNVLPSTVKKIRFTVANGGKSFDPTTGLATETNGTCVRDVESYKAGTSLTCYIFLAAAEDNTDVTVEGLDADGNVLYTQVLKNVPMKQNKKTYATGALFADTATGSFVFNTNWEEGTLTYTW